MNVQVVAAIFKRNFSSYFSSPTGYAFICVFVLLSSIAAFWPNDFFNNNLANLDQLNRYLPLILLVFVPAITMSIWADERRQGTDELLLTIPATDFAVVMGKYLSSVAIYTASLMFSLFCSFIVLSVLGQPDVGLLLSTYLGYWFVGLAMLAIGMVGSFLTGNLTVAFILGAMLNAPLVFAMYAEAFLPTAMHLPAGLEKDWPNFVLRPAQIVKSWSIESQLRDFSRGVISLSSVVFFLLIVVVTLYVSIVLIGRRHWKGHPKGGKSALLAGLLALVLQAIGMLYSTIPGAITVFVLNVVPLLLMIQGHFAAAMVTGVALWMLGVLWAIAAANDHRSTQYFVRTVALIVIAGSVFVLTERYPLAAVRVDISSEGLSRLAPATKTLISKLDSKHPIQIDAFISPEVPESYVQTRLNLLNALREYEALGSGKIAVHIYDTPPLSEEADRAEKLYGIVARPVQSESRGTVKLEDIYLGVAVTSGLKKVVIPFFDHGLPVEYEVARSIATVARQDRKTLGVLTTEAQLFGGFDMNTMSQSANQAIIDELEKQYEVKRVDPEQPITEKYDVLLAVQPSALSPVATAHFIAAVRAGQPTAIFEDPFPMFANELTPTGSPRQQQNPMAMLGGQPPPQPKGDIGILWNLLGIDFSSMNVVWQDYNPYPRYEVFQKEFIFITPDEPGADPFAFNPKSPITEGLRQVLFLFPGWITPKIGGKTQVTSLAQTGNLTGFVPVDEIISRNAMGMGGELNAGRRVVPTGIRYAIAAQIRGPGEAPPPAEGDAPKSEPPKVPEMNVVLVADVDWIYRQFFLLRAEGTDLDFDNVTMVLNLLDTLAGETSYIEIRRHRPEHRTLVGIGKSTQDAREAAIAARNDAEKRYSQKADEIEQKFADDIHKLQNRKDMDPLQVVREVQMAQEVNNRRLQATTGQFRKELEQQKKAIDRELELEIRSQHNRYKLWAALLPPIPPLLVGLGVYFRRRAREREGVARSRLR